MSEIPKRPECFDFAMDFLGCPEAEEVVRYVEQLEAALALAIAKEEGRMKASGASGDLV
jgi:hypothetical protein